jgi:hypothetical protein
MAASRTGVHDILFLVQDISIETRLPLMAFVAVLVKSETGTA